MKLLKEICAVVRTIFRAVQDVFGDSIVKAAYAVRDIVRVYRSEDNDAEEAA